jgi:hypothetical protein
VLVGVDDDRRRRAEERVSQTDVRSDRTTASDPTFQRIAEAHLPRVSYADHM